MSTLSANFYKDGAFCENFNVHVNDDESIKSFFKSRRGKVIDRLEINCTLETKWDMERMLKFLSVLNSGARFRYLGKPSSEENKGQSLDEIVPVPEDYEGNVLADGVNGITGVPRRFLNEWMAEKTPEQILDRFNEVLFSGLSDVEIQNELTLLAKQGFTLLGLAEDLLDRAKKEQPTEGKAYLDYLKTGLPIPFPALQQGHTFTDAELEVIKIAVRQFEFDARFVGREGSEDLMYPENENAVRPPVETMAIHIAQTAKGILDKLGIVPFTKIIPANEIRKSRQRAEDEEATVIRG